LCALWIANTDSILVSLCNLCADEILAAYMIIARKFCLHDKIIV
jgi:hypothetical protein